jgi:hypothetical protein
MDAGCWLRLDESSQTRSPRNTLAGNLLLLVLSWSELLRKMVEFTGSYSLQSCDTFVGDVLLGSAGIEDGVSLVHFVRKSD